MKVDLSNNTKWPDIDEYFGFAPWTLFYLHLQFWVVLIVCIGGNTTVLYSSLKHGSFNLDGLSCALLENLAVADGLIFLIGGVPSYITFLAKKWVLGGACCVLTMYLTLTAGTAEILTLAAISIHRAVALKNPFLLARGVAQAKIRGCVVVIWILACIPSIVILSLDGVIYYEPSMLSCTSSSYTEPQNFYIMLGFMMLLAGFPMLLIFICNIFMLVVSVRYKRRLGKMRCGGQDDNKNAIFTVTLVCWVFLFSWLPWIVRLLCEAKVGLPIWFYLFQTHFLSLNLTLNPVIYTCTNKSFRRVVKDKVLGRITRCTLVTRPREYKMRPIRVGGE